MNDSKEMDLDQSDEHEFIQQRCEDFRKEASLNTSSKSTSSLKKDLSNIDQEIIKVRQNIEEVDQFLIQLKNRKDNLLAKYERLKEEKVLRKIHQIESRDWSSTNFPWNNDIHDALKKTFKMTNFRDQQLKTINAILSRQDVLLLAPTGGGKSLCFQLPAIVQKGITIVVSPLISLMEDQVWSLQKLHINAELLCSTTDKNKVNSIIKELANKTDTSDLKLLYVTPERMAKSKRFMSALQKSYFAQKLDLIAIDEVHCCSQWGHDFRPDYKFLGSLKTMFPDIPLLGLTATATTKVIIDVQKMLNIRESLILKAPFNRPNLYYHVVEKPSEKEEVVNIFTSLLKNRYAGKSGIIYTFSIKDAEDLAAELIKRNVQVRPYHASLDTERRTKIHSKWLNGEIQAVVATVAFGMGIDKPDVRFVIHHTISKSMENFYQESGRAGRDGKKAECLLMYRLIDIFKITGMMFSERTGLKNAYAMVDYCINGTKCRRDIISKHFTEVWKESDCNKMCDRCYHKDRISPPSCDLTKHCKDLQRIIENATNMDIKLTANKLIDAWFHKGSSNVRVNDISPPTIERYYAEQMVAFLIISGYLKEDFHFTAYSTISYIKIGTQKPQANSPITFNGARVLNLPNRTDLWKDFDLPSSTDNDDESNFQTISRKSSHLIETSTPVKPTKKSHSSAHKESPSVVDEADVKLEKKRHSDSFSSSSGSSKKKKSSQSLSSSSSILMSPTRKKSKRHTLEKASIERISSSVSKMVKEIVVNEAKRRKMLESGSSVGDESDTDDIVLIQDDDDDDVITIDD